jgi:PilZ domain
MAAGTPGIDFPENREPVDVQAASRGDALTSFVESSGDAEMVVTVAVDRSGRRVRLEVGEDVQLVWKGPEGLRARPAQLSEVVLGDEPTWRLKPVGPAARGQRRNAVRAPLSLPVEATLGQMQVMGETVDVSEAGLRVLFTPVTGPRTGPEATSVGDATTPVTDTFSPETGAVLDVVLGLDERQAPIRSKVEVVRQHPRTDRRTELSIRFIGLAEREQDRIRARVFTELRLLRSRGVI